MSNKGGRVSPDYLADIAPEYAIWHEGWDRTARKDGIYRMTVKITEPGSVMLAYSNGTSYNFFLEYTATY